MYLQIRVSTRFEGVLRLTVKRNNVAMIILSMLNMGYSLYNAENKQEFKYFVIHNH